MPGVVARGYQGKPGVAGRGFLTRPLKGSHGRLGDGLGLMEAGKGAAWTQKKTPTEVGVPSSLT